MQVSISILHAVFDRALRRGNVFAAALGQTAVGFSPPPGEGSSVPWDVAVCLLDELVRHSEPSEPLRAGWDASVRLLDVVGIAMMAARTYRDLVATAIELGPRLLGGAQFQLVEYRDEARFVFTPPPCSPELTRAMTDFTLGFAGRLAVSVAQQQLRHIEVRHARPCYASEYGELLNCDVRFEAEHNALAFSRDRLDAELPGGSEPLRLALCARARSRFTAQDSPAFAQKVTKVLRGSDLEAIQLEGVAEQLKMSPAALQRRLRVERTSFSRLFDNVRRDVALEWLTTSDLPLKDVSHRLGYSDPRAFHRAFLRWTGETPDRFRRRDLRRGPVSSDRSAPPNSGHASS